MEKVNKQQKDMFAKNNQIFRLLWMSTLGAESSQLKLALEVGQEESDAISEECDTLNAADPEAVESTSAPLTKELGRLRREKRALEQALQEEEKSKSPLQASVPDTPDLEARLVRIVLPQRTSHV
jgi:hypothetical protein